MVEFSEILQCDMGRIEEEMEALFLSLNKTDGFRTKLSSKRLMIFYKKKLGGVSFAEKHFYISKVFAGSKWAEEILHDHGFRWEEKSEKHQYWRLDGLENHRKFKNSIEHLTGAKIKM